MSQPFVAVLMGSDSDLPVLQSTFDVLKSLEIPFEAKITSAHRTPKATHEYVADADTRGCSVFICAAGLAAHLAGAVSAATLNQLSAFHWMQARFGAWMRYSLPYRCRAESQLPP